MRKKSYEDVKNIVESQGSVLLSDVYVNNREELSLKCSCGELFNKSLDNMNRYKKYICNSCSDKLSRNNRKIPYEIIKENIEKEGYTLNTNNVEYHGTEFEINITCPKSHTYTTTYASFRTGRRCEKCYRQSTRERLTISYEDVCKYVKSIGYTVLSPKEKYVDTKSRVEVKCCNGHIYPTRINTLRSGKRCRKCSSKLRGENSRIPYENILDHVESEGYKLLTPKEQYTVTHEKYMFQCDKGHKPYEAKMSEFLQGTRCPTCRESRGEKMIRKVLNKYKINCLEQYTFDDCKLYYKLPFDFYLPDYNLLIEYDGKQHFTVVNSWGGFDGFVTRRIRDSIKNIYCRKNDIELLRIPYFKFNEIENILLNKLKLSQDNTEVIEEIKKSSTP